MDRALVPLLREIGDLKRVTSASRDGSIASRAFATAWELILAGRTSSDVALDMTAACLVATRLGDLDGETLLALGVSASDIVPIRRAALVQSAGAIVEAGLLDRLAARCDDLPGLTGGGGRPAFVASLIRQPRAGATCPGKARIVLGAPENHAEHCLAVAVYGVLLVEPEADVGAVFLAGLAHHLHNAAMPDAGFAGETLLGAHLDAVVAGATAAALAQLPPGIAADVERAREVLTSADTREGRAFHAADVIDRVLEVEQHLARSRVTMDAILGDMALVHEGPIKSFHDRVLATMGLA